MTDIRSIKGYGIMEDKDRIEKLKKIFEEFDDEWKDMIISIVKEYLNTQKSIKRKRTIKKE
jgi:hypothetical protein